LISDMALFLANADLPPGFVFRLDAQTLISMGLNALNVILLAYVLSRLLYKPVTNFLRARAEKVNAQLERAESETAKADELKSGYESKLKDIEAEKDKILEAARKQAVEKKNAILEEAKQESETAKQRASAQIKTEREQAEAAMKQSIIDVAVVMAEKFVTLSLNKDVHDRLFSEAMADLEQLSLARHAELEEA